MNASVTFSGDLTQSEISQVRTALKSTGYDSLPQSIKDKITIRIRTSSEDSQL